MLLQKLLFLPFSLVLSSATFAASFSPSYPTPITYTSRRYPFWREQYNEHMGSALARLGATDDRSADEMVLGRQHQKNIPGVLYRLNSSTKWLITLAVTIGVWSNPKSFVGPFIVVGSIGAVYLTDVLKQIINQDRPAGAPFTDPGMPSSHALVSFFAAAAWMAVVGNSSGIAGKILLSSGATSVAVLRVVCGYHSVAQIIAGGIIGSVLGQLWFCFGQALNGVNSRFAYLISWGLYLAGTAFFVVKNMRHWVGKDSHI